MTGALRRYRVMAQLVGVGLLVLTLVGMPLQYGAGKPAVVGIVGPIHGFLYIVYLAAAYDLARRGTWTRGQMVAVVVAGFVPFLVFFVEHRTVDRVRRELAGERDLSGDTP